MHEPSLYKVYSFPGVGCVNTGASNPLLSGTRQDFHLSGTHPAPSPILARIPPFPLLAWTLLWYSPRFLFFWHLPGFPPFWNSPGFHFTSTRPDSTLSRYSPGPFSGTRRDFHLSGARPDPTFSSICLDFYFSGTRPDSTLFRYSPGSFSGTRPDQSLMFRILRFLFEFDPFCIEFSNTRPDRFPFCFGDSP